MFAVSEYEDDEEVDWKDAEGADYSVLNIFDGERKRSNL